MDAREKIDSVIQSYYQEMYLPLLKYARCILNDQFLAEEAVQETFRIACEKPATFCASPKPNAWLKLTLKNVIRNIQRRRFRLNQMVIASLDQEEIFAVAPRDDQYAEIEYADLLSPDEYQLLKLVALEKYSMPEAAQEFDISVEACKKRVQRVKQKLRKLLEEIENDEAPSNHDRDGQHHSL